MWPSHVYAEERYILPSVLRTNIQRDEIYFHYPQTMLAYIYLFILFIKHLHRLRRHYSRGCKIASKIVFQLKHTRRGKIHHWIQYLQYLTEESSSPSLFDKRK